MMQSAAHQDSLTMATLATIERFNEAFNRHDVDALMALMAGDCIFEDTFPPPDGMRHEGYVAVRSVWERFFDASPAASFEFEETFACGERGVVRWRYHWVEADGIVGHVRGVDLFRVRYGKIVEKLSYVKG
jgi:ketosteroid isomerase-like protein